MKFSHLPANHKRRDFLKFASLFSLGVAASGLLYADTVEAVPFNRKEYKVVRTRQAMGTSTAITAIHSSRDEAERAISLAFEEIDRLQKMLTHFDSCSPVGQLNAAGRLELVPQELSEVIFKSLGYYRETDGAFDITIKPLLDLYKNSFAGGTQPADSEIERTLGLVSANRIYFRDGELGYLGDEMAITLDGIAKGYIIDKASQVLVANGISNHLVNAGGDIRVSGTVGDNRPWNIAVEDPSKSAKYPDIISIRSGGIATSGNYEIYFDQEKLCHHIIDSQTGHSPLPLTSVTVVAPTVMDADALATSVFVMGPRSGMKFINNRLLCECFLIERNGHTSKSRNWPV